MAHGRRRALLLGPTQDGGASVHDCTVKQLWLFQERKVAGIADDLHLCEGGNESKVREGEGVHLSGTTARSNSSGCSKNAKWPASPMISTFVTSRREGRGGRQSEGG